MELNKNQNYLKMKNSMLLHLADEQIRKHLFKVYKNIIKSDQIKTFDNFVEMLSAYDQKQKAKEEISDDAVLIGLERIKVFSEYKFVRGKKGENKKFGQWMLNYNLQSANYVGQFILDGLYKKDYVAWETCNDVKYLKSKNILNKDALAGTYIILLVFPVKKDYPFTLIERIGNEDMWVDNTNPSKYLSEKTYDLLKDSVFVSMHDQGQFVAMFNEEDFDLWKVDRIKLDTPQQRFRFVRKYIAGISQNELARTLIKAPYLQKSDQKKIAYWETSESDFPPFMRDDQLNYCSEIFAKESREFLGLELRDNLNEDEVSLVQIRSWIRDFIRTNPDDKLVDEYPDFIWRVLDYQKTDKRSSKMQSYKDAVKRYEIQERIDQSTIYSVKDITSTMLVEWFAILESMNEREVVADLQLVYDNDFDRSEVYDLWKTIRIKFPKVVKKPIKTNAKQDWSDLWNEVKEEKELSPPF